MFLGGRCFSAKFEVACPSYNHLSLSLLSTAYHYPAFTCSKKIISTCIAICVSAKKRYLKKTYLNVYILEFEFPSAGKAVKKADIVICNGCGIMVHHTYC